MMQERIFTNAQVVLPESVISGTVLVRDGVIADISKGTSSLPSENLDGNYLLPGLVELHTDHLEQHYQPRPGVTWPAVSAVMAHDAQIAASGITTVYDALRAGTFESNDLSAGFAVTLIKAISSAQADGHLRAEHFVHLRCEMPCEDTTEAAHMIADAGDLHLISIMDHTPGARQFVSMDKFKEYYFGKKLVSPDQMEGYIAERLDLQTRHASTNKRNILALAQHLGVKLASHDDATEAHVTEAVEDGVTIAEFPTTREAAKAAHGRGLSVMMGAPNVVRGGSHSGNISAAEVAGNGHLDLLSSDYVPSSLLSAVFALPGAVEGIELADAIRLVTANPARAAGLLDRGAIAVGRRADLVQVVCKGSQPVVRRVWREGRRVM
jgi:alpha-D-ribose 1-methylphosphonate 5-triphosphate diphosphatase